MPNLKFLRLVVYCLPLCVQAHVPTGFASPLAVKLRQTSSLNFFKFPTPTKVPTVSVDEVKSQLFELAKNTDNGIKATPEKREKILGLVKDLEKANKVKQPAKSALLDGSWRLLYTENGGSSAGKLGPFVGNVVQDIRLGEELYLNNVSILGDSVKASLSATWDIVNPNTWKVKFIDINFQVLGVEVINKPFDNVVGTWRMSYVDDKMRILYAVGGKNTTKENIYILVKD